MAQNRTPVTTPNSEQFYLDSEQGKKYLIQISWPLHWRESADEQGAVPIIYTVDGNALFLTATESAWRLGVISENTFTGIVVAIGYPVDRKLFEPERRNPDLTPATGTPTPGHGEADAFLDFIEKSVRPAVKSRFPQVSVSREALYGHSYGGLFTLHALFTRPHSFDFFFASSPSVWWSEKYILSEAEKFVKTDGSSNGKSPSLAVAWGEYEQDPPQRPNETSEQYEKRKDFWKHIYMVDNAKYLCDMLRKSNRLYSLDQTQFDGEDHTTVMAASVTRALTLFFQDWPLPQSASA
ncbi:siderophore esterase [Penicillium angulare]|uniref:Siderophore esterase n=1 Tax=Penicillium angulare TaxID=116970 RepID=A0A9W9GDM0_9EURO|nr:siderophore esterase [Penicillium angulare]